MGEDLLSSTVPALSFNLAYSEIHGGSQEILNAMFQLASESKKSILPYYEAALRVRDAAYFGLSIDNVIHQQYSDLEFVAVAKLAISLLLLKAEDESPLRVPDKARWDGWQKVRGTWLGRFGQLLVQDISKENIDSIFDNVSVVSFNYDRTIRRFLPQLLISQFAVEESRAYQISKKLKIFHPYGSLGPLPWEGQAKSSLFGCYKGADLLSVSRNIRTFTEKLSEEAEMNELKSTISCADQVIFLGFGYLSQNMHLITNDVRGSATSIMGTCYGLSEPDRESVVNQIRVIFKDTMKFHKDPYLQPVKCEEFLRQNFRSITS